MAEENYIYGFAYSCPHLKRIEDCPLKEIDHLSFKEKVDWIDNLSQEEKSSLISKFPSLFKSNDLTIDLDDILYYIIASSSKEEVLTFLKHRHSRQLQMDIVLLVCSITCT